VQLRFVADAAVHGDDTPAAVRGERAAGLLDLAGELARWSDDQGARGGGAAFAFGGAGGRRASERLVAHELKEREPERCGLAGAGLRLPDDIEVFREHDRDGFFLDLRRLFEPLFPQLFDGYIRQAQVFEFPENHCCRLFVYAAITGQGGYYGNGFLYGNGKQLLFRSTSDAVARN